MLGLYSTYVQQNLLKQVLQGTTLTFPATTYMGLILATKGAWAATTSYSSGDTVIPTTAGNGHLYKCTTAGTSGGSTPTFPTGEAATVSDNTVVWTEATALIRNNATTEVPSTNAYARVAITSNSTNWTVSAATNNNYQVVNATAIQFPTSTGTWGYIFGYILYDAASSGNLWFFGALTTPVNVASGITPQFNASAITLTADT